MAYSLRALRQAAVTYGTLAILRPTPLLTPRQVVSNAVLAPLLHTQPAFSPLPIVRLLHASTPFLSTEQSGRYLRLSNLPFHLPDARIWAFCQEHGPVASVQVGRRAADGLPLGWAVVYFNNAEDAQKAALAADRQLLMSRIVRAKVYESNKSAMPAAEFDAETTFYVTDLPPESTRDELRSFYSDHGKIKDAYVRTIRKDGQWSTYGFIAFTTMGETLAALHATNGTNFMGKPITVSSENPDPYTSVNAAHTDNSEVFIKNLPASISATELGDYFLRFGDVVAVRRAKDRYSGKWRPHAFVSFRTTNDAERAAMEANGTLLGDRKIDVSLSENVRTTPPTIPDTRERKDVYVGNIPYHLTESEIAERFKRFGAVVRVDIPKNQDGTSRGFAFVCFETYTAAEEATVKAKDIVFHGRQAHVRW